MNLYTVTAHFSDHRIGIGQHKAISPFEALLDFIKHSESLNGFDRKKLTDKIGSEERLIHIANGLLGFWNWHPVPNSEDVDELDDVLGGHIIQTDPNGPLRENG